VVTVVLVLQVLLADQLKHMLAVVVAAHGTAELLVLAGRAVVVRLEQQTLIVLGHRALSILAVVVVVGLLQLLTM
jgi:hypothetical protein